MFVVDASACDKVEIVVGIEVGLDVCETVGIFVVEELLVMK
jgi:hypothetical protein